MIEGPLDHPESAVTLMARRWVMPGDDLVAGDGWAIEVPGIVITPIVKRSGDYLDLSSRIELMCGCPITLDGLWRAGNYKVEASVWQEDIAIGKVDLFFASEPGGFSGRMPEPGPGHYRIGFHARNIETGNSGTAFAPLRLHNIMNHLVNSSSDNGLLCETRLLSVNRLMHAII